MSEKTKKSDYKTYFSGQSKTKQQFRKQCDVKHIMATYNTTGIHTHANRVAARGGQLLPEWNQENSRHANLNLIAKWSEKYSAIPKKELAILNIQSPSDLLNFAQDPKNIKKSVEFGLIPARYLPKEQPKEIIQKVEIIQKEEKKETEPEKKGQSAV